MSPRTRKPRKACDRRRTAATNGASRPACSRSETAPRIRIKRHAGHAIVCPSPLPALSPSAQRKLSVRRRTIKYDRKRRTLVIGTQQESVLKQRPAKDQWNFGVDELVHDDTADFAVVPMGVIGMLEHELKGGQTKRRQSTEKRHYIDGRKSLNRIGRASKCRWLVQITHERDRIDILAQICRQHKDGQIVVATATRSRCRKLQEQLSGRIDEEIGMTEGLQWPVGPRVVVCTYHALCSRSSASVDMILLPRAEELIGKKPREFLMPFNCPMIGTYRDLAAADEMQQIWIRSLFRDRHVDMTSEKYAVAPVRLQIVPIKSLSVAPAVSLAPHERRRALIWRNVPRNKAIARMARMAARRDPDQLDRAGIILPILSTRTAVLCIIVQNTEHALALLEQLPQAVISHRSISKKIPPSPAQAKISIMTLVAAQQQKISADVIIVASGGESLPELLHASKCGQKKEHVRSRWIIDFADTISELAVVQKKAFQAYAKAGWIFINHPTPKTHSRTRTRNR